MMIIFCAILLFPIGGCTQEYTTKTVPVGEDVTLACTRKFNLSGYLFWMKCVAGNLPEVLGATYTFNHGTENNTPRIIAKQELGTFILQIKQTQLNDTAFYYCEEVIELRKTLLNLTFLNVKGPEPQTTTIVQELPSIPAHLGDSVTLQCSVLSDPANLSCSDHHRVHWFKAGSDDSHPNVLYVCGNNGDKCKRIPEAPSAQKCIYNFSWSNISSSDAGTYYCAVATCGQILFGKGTKLEIEGPSYFSHSLLTSVFIVLLSTALAVSMAVIVKLNNTIKQLKKDVTEATADPEITSGQQSQLIKEDDLVYSVPNFTKKKAEQKVKRGAKAAKGQSIYADVRTLGYE